VEPHRLHFDVVGSQANGSAHTEPPWLPVQHGSLNPPHATHDPAAHVANGAVQPTPPPQHACPILPHVPPWQPPPVQTSCAPPHVPAAATHVCVVPSQQPFAAHELPSQQGCPEPPHAVHFTVDAEHAMPDATQKSPALPCVFGFPTQHACVFAPQTGGPLHELVPHVPSAPPHVVAVARHFPAVQHEGLVHELFAQHG
jgi:hypothetical protein